MRTWTVLVNAAFVIALAAPAAAQGTGARPQSGAADDRSVLGAGVSFLTDGDETGTGIAVDFSKPLASLDTMSIGGVGDFGWHAFDGFKSMTFMGGGRVAVTVSRKVAPFGQFLIGSLRTSTSFCEDCSETHLAFGPGGGVDITLTNRLKFRAQVDFFIIRFGDDEEAANVRRFTFGLSLPIGD